MKLKSHYFTDTQIKFLERKAKKDKVSQAEIVRDALDNHMKQEKK